MAGPIPVGADLYNAPGQSQYLLFPRGWGAPRYSQSPAVLGDWVTNIPKESGNSRPKCRAYAGMNRAQI